MFASSGKQIENVKKKNYEKKLDQRRDDCCHLLCCM